MRPDSEGSSQSGPQAREQRRAAILDMAIGAAHVRRRRRRAVKVGMLFGTTGVAIAVASALWSMHAATPGDQPGPAVADRPRDATPSEPLRNHTTDEKTAPLVVDRPRFAHVREARPRDRLRHVRAIDVPADEPGLALQRVREIDTDALVAMLDAHDIDAGVAQFGDDLHFVYHDAPAQAASRPSR